MDNCIHLNVSDKLVLRAKPDMSIYYVNDDFERITGINTEEALLRDFFEIIPYSMQDLFKEVFFQNLKENEPSYFIIKGKTKDGQCYWGLMRVSPFKSKLTDQLRYLIEIKMLPHNAINESEKIFSVIEKVYENAGKTFAKKYFDGFLEDNNVDFETYIFNTLGASKKKIDKYFNLA